jgi:hypothetical protein
MLAVHLLSAAQDTDRTGAFGALIDYWYLPIVAFLQSLVLKLFELAGPRWRALNEGIKWSILYAVGIAITWVSGQLGFNATVDGVQLTDAAVLASIPTMVAGLIFKFGRHKVPPTTPTTPR